MAHKQLLLLNRGAGLFLGVELVEDRDKRTPATQKAAMLVKRYGMRVLCSFLHSSGSQVGLPSLPLNDLMFTSG